MNGVITKPPNRKRNARREHQSALSFSISHVVQNLGTPQITDEPRRKNAVTQFAKIAISNLSNSNHAIRDEQGRNTVWRTGALWKAQRAGDLFGK